MILIRTGARATDSPRESVRSNACTSTFVRESSLNPPAPTALVRHFEHLRPNPLDPRQSRVILPA